MTGPSIWRRKLVAQPHALGYQYSALLLLDELPRATPALPCSAVLDYVSFYMLGSMLSSPPQLLGSLEAYGWVRISDLNV
ncbi:hypothetical protein SCP_0705640 [Sparassis crispa]|uniref:Uncharacterized protein n=1 Tax=Sparassis crispa TaxID=139825 RepID=A0A401GT42_9APHY|nr:hypothetical protein SCP_0705640 [Sparassis crispa]GBE85377.1 hypothetical protein SCP_0705640 [Sparassis crispa]